MSDAREMGVVHIMANKKKRKVYPWQSSWEVVGEFLQTLQIILKRTQLNRISWDSRSKARLL